MFRLDAHPVVNGVANPLFAAKISLGGLDRHVSTEKLNLVEFTAGLMAEPRKFAEDRAVQAYQCRLFLHTV